MIVQPTSVVEGEWPKLYLEFVWPVKECVLHHGASLFGHRTDRSLGHAVLMVCADSREFQFLVGFGERIKKFLGLEDTIIAVVCFDLDSTRLSGALESSF
jgi:hypothetical protein